MQEPEIETSLRVPQLGGPSTTVMLTKEQGEALKALIEQDLERRWVTYINEIGLHQPNVLAILGGRKKLSKNVLDRLLSGTDYIAECRIEFVIQKRSGSSVNNVDCPNLDDMLFSEQLEGWMDEGALTEEQLMDGAVSTGEENQHKELSQALFPQVEVMKTREQDSVQRQAQPVLEEIINGPPPLTVSPMEALAILPLTSSSSEKPLENTKTPPLSDSQDKQDESST